MKRNLEKWLGSLAQFTDFAVPLLVLALLARTFELQVLSLLVFNQAIFALINIIVELGQNNYYIQSLAGRSMNEIKSAFWEFTYGKALIAAPILLIVFLTGDVTNIAANHFLIFLAQPLVFLCDTKTLCILTERFSHYCLVSITSKLVYLAMSLLLIKQGYPINYILALMVLYPLIIYLPFFPGFIRPSIKAVFFRIRMAKSFFSQKISQNIYLNLPVVFVNYFGTTISPIEVSIPQKIFNAATMMANPILTLNFRDMSERFDKSKFWRFFKIINTCYIFVATSVALASSILLETFLGQQPSEVMLFLLIALVLCLPLSISNAMIGNSIIAAKGHAAFLAKSSFFSLIVCMFLLSLSVLDINLPLIIILSIIIPKVVELLLRLLFIYRRGLLW